MRLGYNNVLDRPKREREEPPERVVAPVKFQQDWNERLDLYHQMARQHERGLKFYRSIDDKIMVAHLEEQQKQNQRDIFAASDQFHHLKNVQEQFRHFREADRAAERGDPDHSDDEQDDDPFAPGFRGAGLGGGFNFGGGGGFGGGFGPQVVAGPPERAHAPVIEEVD
jgi:hypothetical protein